MIRPYKKILATSIVALLSLPNTSFAIDADIAIIDGKAETNKGKISQIKNEAESADQYLQNQIDINKQSILNISLTPGDKGDTGLTGAKGDKGDTGDSCQITNDFGVATITCPIGPQVSFKVPYCGNNIVELGEECDGSISCLSDCLYSTDHIFQDGDIATLSEQETINQWVGSNEPWVQCYSKATDINNASVFHNNCDNKGPTITIIQTIDGTKFGGYNDSSWNQALGNYNYNPSNFLFSLTNNFRHNHYRYSYSTYNNTSYGPTFGGGHDLYVSTGMGSGYCNIGHTYTTRVGPYGSTEARNDFCGSYQFVIDKLEVYYQP